MSHRGEGTIYTSVGLILTALVLFLFPPILRLVVWVWVATAVVLSIILVAALVFRSLILPYTNPDLYRLVVNQHKRARMTPVPR